MTSSDLPTTCHVPGDLISLGTGVCLASYVTFIRWTSKHVPAAAIDGTRRVTLYGRPLSCSAHTSDHTSALFTPLCTPRFCSHLLLTFWAAAPSLGNFLAALIALPVTLATRGDVTQGLPYRTRAHSYAQTP